MEIERRDTTAPTVLLPGSDGAAEWVDAALPTAATLRVLSDVAAVTERVRAEAADCVCIAPATGSDVAAVETIRAADPDVPIVYAPAEPDGAEASDATGAGATEYLPRSTAADGELADRVERAVADYDRRRQAEREQGMLRELLGSAPLSIYFKDRDARHVAVTSHTTGAFDQSFVGKTDEELYAAEIGEELAKESLADDLQVIESGERVLDLEERHVTPEGEELWLRTSKFPWRDEDGEVVGLIGITRDVTEIMERERELEAEKRRLEQFASFASHDLRNPVAIASGYLEQARSGAGDLEDAHEAIEESLERMDQLIDDLLNMARPGEDREIDGWADLGDVAERAWAVGGDDAASLEIAVPDGTEIYAAEGALRQLLENVFSNALDHGSADAAVELGLTETGFYVADDGPGIPAEDREAVFEYGYTTGGTGVGLAITKEIAAAHGWAPRATESDGGGARFEFDGVIRRPPPVEEKPLSDPATLDRTHDVGGATPPGDFEQLAEDAWVLEGGGENLWGDLEEYFALAATATGDCRIEARLTGLDGHHEYSKAGVFIADSVEPGAVLGLTGMTASHGAETACRFAPGEMVATEQYEDHDALPASLRIDRIGDRCTCWHSLDGQEWTPIDQAVLPLGETAAVGLAVCSRTPERLCEARFEDVRVVGLDPVE